MYQKIMVPLDGSKLAECVFPYVKGLVQGKQAKNLVFVRVIEPLRSAIGGEAVLTDEQVKKLEAERRQDAEIYLRKVLARMKFRGVKVEGKVLNGNAAETLSRYATRKKMNVVVIATHGRSGVSRWVWGSVTDLLLRYSCVPI
ncbi:MAG: universal stress protein, partial [Deltaproteobacteria bacterium]|nr:universal stress protein [Deltaproteobacteria bacterium]